MTREIPLNHGLVALVDDADFEWLSRWRWSINRGAGVRATRYAVRGERRGGHRLLITMHRVIMGAEEGQLVDHVNGDGLDNRRSNLRFCDHAQNMRNRRISRHNKAGYKGVHIAPDERRWRAVIQVDGRQKSLGGFSTAFEAARAYDVAALRHHGPFARLNFDPARDWIFTHEHGGPWPPEPHGASAQPGA